MTPKSRNLIFAAAGLVVLIVVGALLWQRQSTPSDPSAGLPFRPKVTYESGDISITNTEEEPYLETSFHLYVDGTLYSRRIGTISPGETVTRPLLSLQNERGEMFNPTSTQISELEVRANFRGQEVHKDFPPPPR